MGDQVGELSASTCVTSCGMWAPSFNFLLCLFSFFLLLIFLSCPSIALIGVLYASVDMILIAIFYIMLDMALSVGRVRNNEPTLCYSATAVKRQDALAYILPNIHPSKSHNSPTTSLTVKWLAETMVYSICPRIVFSASSAQWLIAP